MAVATTERTRWGNAHRHFLSHLATMPRSYKLVLLLGFALAIFGGAGWVLSRTSGVTPGQTVTSSAAPAGHSGFVTDSGAPAGGTSAANPPDGMVAKFSPGATRIGVSVVAGFVFGWFFRAFLKTMVFFALLGAGILAALSYFGVLNVDFSAAREHYASAVHWLTDQSSRLKDLLVSHLPSSGGGAVGAFLGFRRK